MYSFCRKTPEELKEMRGSEEYKTLVSSCYLDEKFPPSFIIGSDKDPLLAEAERGYESLKKAGTRCEFFLSKGINGVHAGALSCDRGKYGKACAAETEKFLKEILK